MNDIGVIKMKITVLILLVVFSISLAYAHPNHMSFETVKHDEQSQQPEAEKMTHRAIEEKYGHSDTPPCTEQHKAMPCKKK